MHVLLTTNRCVAYCIVYPAPSLLILAAVHDFLHKAFVETDVLNANLYATLVVVDTKCITLTQLVVQTK